MNSLRHSKKRFNAPLPSVGGSFAGRKSGEWNDRAYVCGYISLLCGFHELNDVFIEAIVSILDGDKKNFLVRELHGLCEGVFFNAVLKDELDDYFENSAGCDKPSESLVYSLIRTASNAVNASQLRAILGKTIISNYSESFSSGKVLNSPVFMQLQRIFSLQNEDLLLMAFFQCMRNCDELATVVASWTVDELYYGISICTGISENICQERLLSQSPLLKKGIVLPCESRNSQVKTYLCKTVYEFLSAGGRDTLGGTLVDLADGPVYSLDSFQIDKTSQNSVIDLLSNTTGFSRINILFYGKEGSGKTQFAKAVASAAGKKLYMYHQEGNSERTNGDDLFKLSMVCGTLDGNSDILLVDEAEDLLATGTAGGFFSMPAPASVKGRVHDILDSIHVPIIWIVNHINRMDASTRRRFTFSIEFQQLSASSIRSFARSWIQDLPISENVREKIVNLSGNYGLTAASLKYLRDTVSAVINSETDPEVIMKRVQCLFESNIRLLSGKTPLRPETGSSYSLEVLNTSVSAESLLDLAMRALAKIERDSSGQKTVRCGLRLLFQGASGTGKTEFARYLSEKLERPLTVKRASDILGMYVGESEKNVSKMFGDASASRSILLIDEADSFFYDRTTAAHSWERTLVNEFLVAMEEFSGVLICTTNLSAILDVALSRRFHEIVEFYPLIPESIQTLLARYYPGLQFSGAEIASIAELRNCTPGDFGALKGRTEFMDAHSLSPEYVIESLSQIVKAKSNRESHTIGF